MTNQTGYTKFLTDPIVEGWADSILVKEGQLQRHYSYADRWWDQLIYAVHKDAWNEVASLFRAEWPDR